MNDKSSQPDTHDNVLKNRMAKGVVWVGAATLGTKIISVATTIILARILSPSDFGLVALASIVMNALLIFNDLGLGPAIVHSRSDRNKVASTAFVMMPVVGITLTAIAFVTAPLTASLLGNPAAVIVIRLLSFNLFFSSLAIVPSMLLEKDMAYRRKFLPDFIPVIIYLITTVVLATFFHLGVYSLVFGQLVQGLCLVIFNWIACPWRPRRGFDRKIAAELWGFGKHILGGSTVAYLATNLDNMFVSRNGGPTQLGYYTMSYSIANLPATHMADIFSRVLFPSFVSINQDRLKLKKAYVKSIRLVILLVFPIIALMAGLSIPMVKVLLGDKWLATAPIITILSIFTVIRVLSSITSNLFLAINKPRVILITGIISLTNQLIALYIFVSILKLGGAGAAMAVSIASVISWLIIYAYVNQNMHFGIISPLKKFIKWVSPAVTIGLLGWWLQSMFTSSLLLLIVLALTMLTLYALLLRLIGEYTQVKQAIILLLKRKAT